MTRGNSQDHAVEPPCCPQIEPTRGYRAAQAQHEAQRAADPGHEQCPSVCCCWDCRGWEAADPDALLPLGGERPPGRGGRRAR